MMTVYSSLEKLFKQAQLEGKLYPQDVYILNILYKLLGCNFELSKSQYNCIFELYNNILLNSQYVCPILTASNYQTTPIQTFTQAEVTDNNDYPITSKIIYWQEDDYSTSIESIQALITTNGYLEDKLSDSYQSFNTGKLISYKSIGRISFLLVGSGNNTYTITDELGNNVTDAFVESYIPSLNSKLFISTNVYSHGDMKFKIKLN
ncbi:MAG TPA: hypothetical protein VF680_16825 [Allosphingosinicella sp.]